MHNSDLDIFKDWFTEYTHTFYTNNADDDKNISLKIRHTSLVCENAVRIAQEEHLSANDVRIAEAAALFHDIGRFLQYSRYKTFRDSISVNHGRLGAEILKEKNILAPLPAHEQTLLINTVAFHNAFKVPSFEDQQKILFLHLTRDADKLDIWRVFAEYYENPEEEQASAASIGLPDRTDYSTLVLSCLYQKRLASFSDLKTQTDFKLMQLAWVYGLHFKHAYKLMADRNLINRISATLPPTDEIAGAIAILKEFVDEKLGAKTNGLPSLTEGNYEQIDNSGTKK